MMQTVSGLPYLAARKPPLQWLSLDNREDYARYRRHWEEGKFQRPHDHPGFMNLVRPANCSAVVALYCHAPDAWISYPFFQCDLSAFTEFRETGRGLSHLISPYGYGGPIYEGPPEQKAAASAAFEELLNRELAERAFVSEFVREDIFEDRLALRSAGELEERPNVVIRLDKSPEAIWQGYTHAAKGNVKRANKAGLRAVFDPDGERLDGFLDVYFDTMRRRKATDDFFIPRQKFLDLGASLGKQGRVTYVHVYHGNEVVASELLLLSHDAIYSFLGGSLEAALNMRPNNLLKHEVIRWGSERGYKWLVLGGGLSANDELLRFKCSFGPDGLVPFRTRKIIHDKAAYERLVEARMKHEIETRGGWVQRLGFFPTYLS